MTPASFVRTAAQATAVLIVPVVMVLGYLHAGRLAALRLGIEDFRGDYLEGLVWALALLISIMAWPVSGPEKRALCLLWLIRVGVMMGVMLGYEAFYGLDASMYYERSAFIGDPLAFFGFGTGTNNIVALTALMRELTDSYSALKLFYGYAGLAAVFVFYRAAVIVLGRQTIGLLFLLGMFPSILFWSSILGKDPVVLLGIALYTWGVAGWLMGRGPAMLFAVATGILIGASIRVWLGPILLAPLLATAVLTGRLPIHAKIGFLALAVPLGLLALKAASAKFAIASVEDLVGQADRISQAWAHGGSGQQIAAGFGSLGDMIAFMPLGGFSALFRPLPGEVGNVFGLFAGLENAAILCLLLFGLSRSGIGWIREPVLFWAVALLGIWAAAYGFASYQNLGTAFRFRVQVAPVLVLLTVLLAFWPRLVPAENADPAPVPAE